MMAIGIALAYSAGLFWSTWRLRTRPLSLLNFLANALFDIALLLFRPRARLEPRRPVGVVHPRRRRNSTHRRWCLPAVL